MILIKLGGSVITDKSKYRSFNEEQTSRLCKEIAASGKGTMVVHGAGSFGHVLAKRYSLQYGLQDFGQVPAVCQVQYDVRDLGQMVVRELMKAGIPAVSVAPSSCFVMDNGELVENDMEAIRALGHLGVMPVMFGDVVMDRSRMFGICSGDQIMKLLARTMKPDRIVFVSDVDGLFTSDPKTDPEARMITEVTKDTLEQVCSEMLVSDVTGGIRGKIEEMLEMCEDGKECILVNGAVPGRLQALLMGEDVPCTRVKA